MWTYWTVASSPRSSSVSRPTTGRSSSSRSSWRRPLLLGNVIWESMMQTEVPRSNPGTGQFGRFFRVVRTWPRRAGARGMAQWAQWGMRTYFVVFGSICTLPGLWILLSRKINAGRRGPGQADRQLRSHRQGHTHQARTPLRRTWVYNLRSKRPTLGLAHAAAADLNPLVVRRLIDDVRHEDPVLASFFDAVDDDDVAGAHAVPARRRAPHGRDG